MTDNKYITTQDINIQIIRIMLQAILTFPDWSFSKLLRNLEIVKEQTDNNKVTGWCNEEYTPSEVILRRIDPYNSLLKDLAEKQAANNLDNRVLLLAVLDPHTLGTYIAEADMQPTTELKTQKLIELCHNHFIYIKSVN